MNRCARTAITLALFSLIAATAWADAPNAAREVAVPGEASPSVVSPLASPRVPLGGVLYDNGSLVTHPGGGSGGADASSLQDTSLLMTIFGFGHALAANIRVADDFTVPAGGWNVSQIVFFAYQTGSSTTSTINHVNLQIWDGPPGAPSNIVFGDTATNRLATSTFSNVYRTLESAGQAGTTRPLMANATTVSTFLPAGTYWVDWQTGGTLGSGPWVAPVTILGQTGKPGANGLQALTPGVWSAALDVAAQDFPFIIEGTPGGCTLTCPADQNANTDAGVCTATVNYPAPTTSGSCGPIVCTPAAGSSFGLGVTAVNCVDEGQPGFGPQASCSFNVTVTDIEPPAISCPADINQEIPVGEIDGTVVWPAEASPQAAMVLSASRARE